MTVARPIATLRAAVLPSQEESVRALITGGAGFIGSHIAERLVREGHEVRIIDNLSSGHQENLQACRGQIDFTKGDIRDRGVLEGLCKGCQVIFHEAAVVSVPYSVAHPQETHDVNLQGTLNVLQAARAQGVSRVVYACSAAVYGDDSRLPKSEEMAPAPISPYGVEKISGEYYLSVFNQLYEIQTVSLRYFNVFGPRQDPRSPYSGVISIFVDKLLSGQQPLVYGDGEQSRDFVYVANVVEANLLAATAPRAAGRCYNVGSGQRTTLNQLLAILGQLAGRELTPDYCEPRSGDILHSLSDISRAAEELGYAPLISVEQGLAQLLDYARVKRTGQH